MPGTQFRLQHIHEPRYAFKWAMQNPSQVILSCNVRYLSIYIQSGPLIVNHQGTMLSCSYYKDFILSRLASVLLL